MTLSFKLAKGLLLLILMMLPAQAIGQKHEIDISSCVDEPCFSTWVHRIRVEQDIEVQAWFDIADPFGRGYQSFYPLFNAYNRSAKPVEVEIGLRLLSNDGGVLVRFW